jgi:hypothetical protein
MTTIQINQPHFWWRAPANTIRRWVRRDPDAIDGQQRHPDRDEQDWRGLAQAVSSVSRVLAAGRWQPSSDETGEVVIVAPPFGHNEPTMLRQWFAYPDEVRFDPWIGQVCSGRHRLWGTLPYFGNRLVPVQSNVLTTAVDFGPDQAEQYQESLERLQKLSWFDASDPVNQRFVASLKIAAEGRTPPCL